MTNSKNGVTFYPLGGLGEIGLNCMVMEYQDHMVLIDCGLLFPETSHFGVNIIVPNFEFLIKNKKRIRGIILTHGHEDHIGALPWLLPFVQAPIYGSPFTLGLVKNKLIEHGLDKSTKLHEMRDYDTVAFGELRFHFFPVCHSIVAGFGLGIETPVGKIVHTGDFKIDLNPLHGIKTDLDAFKNFAENGVKLLFSDSTNAEREGFSLTERQIFTGLKKIISKAKKRIIITLFASHIQRIQEIFDLAKEHNRKVVISGKSLARNIELARNLNYLNFAAQTIVALEDIHLYKDEELILLVTGSQGEPLATLSRLSKGEHRQIRIKKDDLVLLSSRPIPSNITAISKVIDNLYRLGAEVIYNSEVEEIHASGHAYQEELKIMLNTVNPEYFVPVHGEYRHLVKHLRLAIDSGVESKKAILLEDGTPLCLTEDGVFLKDPIECSQVLIDGKTNTVKQNILKEREYLSQDGVIIILLVMESRQSNVVSFLDLITKGFVCEREYGYLVDELKCLVHESLDEMQRNTTKSIDEKIKMNILRFSRKYLNRSPLVLPIVRYIK